MADSKETEKLKEQIFKLIIDYYNKTFGLKEEFIPGKTKINYAGRVFDEQELIKLIDSSLDFWLTEGRYTTQLQKELTSYIGTKYCLFTTSGSSANLLAISALASKKLEKSRRLLPGDEVITVAAGFPTTIFPIIQNNAVPVFIDIELETYNIDTKKLEDAITSRTKAVILAHTLGNPFDINKVKSFCTDYNLWFIEDNCDALGSKYQNKYTGSFGDISTYSFYPAHHITMGEGGALTTNDPLLNKIINSMREWGRDCWCLPGKDNTCAKRFEWQLGTLPYGYDHKYTFSEFGYNLKITDMQAAVGIAQLQKLPSFIEARRRNHKRIFNGLKDYEHNVILPKVQKDSEPSWFGFLITIKDGTELSRTNIMKNLEADLIQTRLLFAGNIVRQPVFSELRESKKGYRIIDELLNTDKVMNDSFWVGVYPGLTDQMLDYMISRLRNQLH